MLGPEFSDANSQSPTEALENAALLDKYIDDATELRRDVIAAIHALMRSPQDVEWAHYTVESPYAACEGTAEVSAREILIIAERPVLYELPKIRIVTNEIYETSVPDPESPGDCKPYGQVMSEDFGLSGRSMAYYCIAAAENVPGGVVGTGAFLFNTEAGGKISRSSNVKGLPYRDILTVDGATRMSPYASDTLEAHIAALDIGKRIFAETVGVESDKWC